MIPEGLHERGAALWSALGCDDGTPAGAVALEACRIADRLDELDRVIAGKGVLHLMQFRLRGEWLDDDEHHVVVKVEFSNVLAEARQQAGTLRALLDTLGIAKAKMPQDDKEASPLAQVLELARANSAIGPTKH